MDCPILVWMLTFNREFTVEVGASAGTPPPPRGSLTLFRLLGI